MKPQTKRYILIALMAITGLATLGIIAVFFLASGYRTEEFVALAGAGLGFLVLISFAATTTFDHSFWKWPALVGMSIAAITMFIHPFWAFLETNRVYSASTAPSYDNSLLHIIERVNGIGFTLAGLLCLTAFIMTPNIKFLGRLLQPAVTLSYLAICVCIHILMWSRHYPGRDFDKFFVSCIIFAIAGTIAISILNKFFGIKIKNPVTYSSTTLYLQCPRCRTFQDLSEGESACLSCKLKFKIEVEEPVCPTCGYNLHMLTSSRCPECGTVFRLENTPTVLAPDPRNVI
ncbi:MAG: hypothetical protein FWD53_04865 [Phycisphaerales bacterium]|nr:hypothetical protein [Phycisphaerales bacterium]